MAIYRTKIRNHNSYAIEYKKYEITIALEHRTYSRFITFGLSFPFIRIGKVSDDDVYGII